MTKFTLVRKPLSTEISRGQAEAVFKYLQPISSHHTLDELVSKAELDDYKSLFNGKGSPSVPKSLTYHLCRFAMNGILNITND
jgi:hypothetical protein